MGGDARPHVDGTGFGWLEIEGERYEHDVLIRLGGKIKRRKKKLSKQVYGTSHTISLDEARHVFEERATTLIVGGNLKGSTRVLTTAIVMETGRGRFEVAIAFSLILLFIMYTVMLMLTIIQQRRRPL